MMERVEKPSLDRETYIRIMKGVCCQSIHYLYLTQQVLIFHDNTEILKQHSATH